MFAALAARGDGRGARAGRNQARRPVGAVLARLGALAPRRGASGCPPTVGARRRRWPHPARDRTGGCRRSAHHQVSRRRAAGSAMMLPGGPAALVRPYGPGGRAQIMARIRAAGTTIVFVNTRAQAELLFQELWKLNDADAADRHPSRQPGAGAAPPRRSRRWPRDGCARWSPPPRSISASTGAAWTRCCRSARRKGCRRLLQRVGRANHRMDEASRAILVPANRFEVLECEAAILGVAARELDGDPPRPGGLDVLAQHILGVACAAPFLPDALYAEVRRAAPYAAPDAAGFRRRAGVRRERRLCAGGLRPLAETVPRRRGADARALASGRPPAPHEHRHHRRGTAAEGAPGRARRRPARRGRGVFRQHAGPRRHASCSPAAC